MVRMRADQSNRGTPQVNPIPISQFEEEQRSEGKKKHRWPAVAITATYRYLLEGVRTLGQAYSAYHDRNTQ